jgi:hypothetical protein
MKEKDMEILKIKKFKLFQKVEIYSNKFVNIVYVSICGN